TRSDRDWSSDVCSSDLRRFEKSDQFDLEDRLLRFAANVIRLVDDIPNQRAGNHVAAQFLRSGTSVLPNHGEAQAAESPKDFLHKIGRASCRESVESSGR